MEVGCLGKLSAVCHGCSVHSCRIECIVDVPMYTVASLILHDSANRGLVQQRLPSYLLMRMPGSACISLTTSN